jgi:hypothetical protein
LVTAGSAAVLAPTAAAHAAAPAKLAPALDGTAKGGAVIVWLKDQHSNLSLSTQGAARTAAAHADQKPIVADMKANGATNIVQLVSVNAVAAHLSAAEVARLRALSSVKQIVPDSTVPIGSPQATGPTTTKATTPDTVAAKDAKHAAARRSDAAADGPGINPFPTVNNCGTQTNPLIEPEALSAINAPAMTNAGLTTEPGDGVVVANDGISASANGDLVGNPNFVRPAADGGGSVVIGATPGDTTDSTDGEFYGDASSIAAQGGVEYQYANELPFSNLPSTCYFKIVGDAPGASLVDTDNIDTPESAAGDPASSTTTESAIVAGIDTAVMKFHADVINESFGFTNTPGSYASHYAANDAAVAAGVTVVVSSGDSGDSGTVSSPASDPLVIAAGATNTLRETAMAYGFTGWVNNDITPLSSGGTTPNNKLVDLVAPGYGGEAACNPDGSDCPTNTQTEAFGGTSQAAPLTAGAAADVIEAYRNSHNGDSPSPAVVKQVLTSTATDVDAPADQQGAGLLNIAAAVAAAQQLRNTTVSGPGTALIATPTQLDLTGNGGTSNDQVVSLYNTNNASTTVTGSYRELGPQTQIGSTVTENVSTDAGDTEVPVDGAPAAANINFTVPAGLDRLDADMIWPDPTNNAILNYILIDPQGKLRQLSYDFGTASTTGGTGSVPNIGHVEVANPPAGQWTVEVKWANGRDHLQSPPNIPGTYTGPLQFKVSGQNWITTPATTAPVTIGAHNSANIPLSIAMPSTPGDHPESVQFTAANGATTSLPVARRTLIPSSGGPFNTTFTSTVGRGDGQISTYNIDVPAGDPNLGVTFQTPDTSADDPFTMFMVNPSGTSVLTHTTTTGTPPRTRTVNGLPLAVSNVNGTPMRTATGNIANPAQGVWEIDIEQNLTTSGLEFSQTMFGDVLPQAPTISSPTDGSAITTTTPLVGGTGVSGDTVTVVDGSGDSLCTSPVASDGTWSCTTTALPSGPTTLTATQADSSNDPSPVSNAVTVTVPTSTSVALSLDPAAPALNQPVTLTATTTGVADGTVVTFLDGTTTLGTGAVASGTATLALPSGLSVGSHALTASVPATATTFGSVSPEVDVTISKTASTIALSLTSSTVVYGHAATGTIAVTGATTGTATVSYGSATVSVPIDNTGTGTFSLPATLSPRAYTITAVYNGTDTVAASDPTSTTLTVTKAPTTTSIVLGKTTAKHNSKDTVAVTVRGHAGARYPSGLVTVTASIGKTTTTKSVTLTQKYLGTRTVKFILPNKVGKASVVVHYAGDGEFTSSVSATKTVKTT